MNSVVTVGKRLVPREHIAFVEPFDATAKPDFQTTRTFQGRVVLVDRDSILIEQKLEAFAEANAFRMLPLDKVALNPAVRFRVETFVAPEDFKSSKAFATRILWRDFDGNEQSKLLLSDPQSVLASVVLGVAPAPEAAAASEKRRSGTTRKRQRQPRAYALHP